MNYLAMYDSDWLRAVDLQGKPRIVTIRKVEGGVVQNLTKKSRKPVVYFKEYTKPLALNKSNGKSIASLYTGETTAWVGKQVVLYETETTMNGDVVPCIRIRPPGGVRAVPPPQEQIEEPPPPAEDEGAVEEPPVADGYSMAASETTPAEDLADLKALLNDELKWKRPQQDMWTKERFGRIQEGLTKDQMRVAFKLLLLMGRPDEYKAELASQQAAGGCK